jgi:hypothetical protein
MIEFRWLGASSIGVSSDALFPGRATNTWVVGASADDAFALGRVVRTMGFTIKALPPRMVRAG